MILKDYIKENPNFIITQKTKTCIDCKKRKSIFLYDYRRDTQKLKNQCHDCVIIKKIQWKKNNRDKVIKGSRERYKKYRKEICYRQSVGFLLKEKKFEVLKRKRLRSKLSYYKDKAYYSTKSAKQRALRRNQKFPKGVECKEVLNIYRKRNEMNKKYKKPKYSVDHIIPLKNKYVSGLHVACNLRIIDTKENLKKGNKFIPFQSNEFYDSKFW